MQYIHCKAKVEGNGMKGRGRSQLLAGALCLTMLFADLGSMGLRVMAGELGAEKSAVSGDAKGQDTDADHMIGLSEGEEGTGNETNPIEGSSGGSDEQKPSEGNGAAGSELGVTEGNEGTGCEADAPEAGDSADGKSGSTADSDEKQDGDGTQGWERAPRETENMGDKSGEETDVERGGEDAEAEVQNVQDAPMSGKCGDNLMWELEDETLKISGMGEMYDYTNYNKLAPWKEYSGSMNKLVIESGVTSIGEFAFWECSGFTGDLTIPNSVTSIGDYAFEGCSGFTGNLTISNSVTSIGYCAFAYCSGFIGDLIIPNSVKNIDRYAFCECSGFNGSLTISSSVTSIERDVFAGCSGFTGKLVIPEGVTYIGDRAFWGCSGFTGDLIIPRNVTYIDNLAFCNCSGFDGRLIIPNSVTGIGISAFYECCGFIGGLAIPDGITRIENGTFNGCSGFTGNLSIPDSVTEIGETAFYRCSGFTGSLTIPNSVTSIGEFAFGGCSSFTGELTLPDRLTQIEDSVFSGCSGFTGELTLPDGVQNIGTDAFYGCNGFVGNLKIPTNVTGIGRAAFCKCSGFTGDLIISNKVKNIGSGAFHGCNGLGGKLVVSGSVTTIAGGAFYECSSIDNIIFAGDAPAIEAGIFTFKGVTAKVYYPSWKLGWNDDLVNQDYGGALTWIPYAEGTAPWEMDNKTTAPGILLYLETNPKTITYKESFSCLNFDMNITFMCMLPSIEAPTYDNVTAKIELSDGLSYAENAVNKSYTKNLGTMNFDAVKKQDISVPVYIDQDNITSEFQVTVSVIADGYESAQTKTFSIPVDLSVDRAGSIVDAVERYTALDEIREVTAIMASCESDEEMMEKLFEYYNNDNMMDVADRISTLSATHRESWDYNSLIQNEIFLSYQYYNYLNNTPKGVWARACLYGSGLVFNGEIKDWVNLPTYLDGDYPGVEKYKSMLEEFIEKESEQIEYYSTLRTTQNFINDSIGLCSKLEKGEVLKELDKQKNVVGVHSVFNNFCKGKINGLDGKDIVFNFEEKTPFMEAMGMVGTSFKMTNMTVDGMMDFVDVSANLETYKLYHNFLQEIYEADDLPWELVAAAYKLDKEMADGYWTPVKNILNTIRDECFDKALNLEQFSAVVEAKSYLAAINYTAFVINQFVDVGKLVVNSCHTEGYAFLQMHYRNKLVQYKNEFVADKTPENAWKFYEAYMMLWKLRKAGEEKYLAMNKLEGGKVVDNLSQWITGGTLSGLLSDVCGYKEKEAAVKQNLELLDKLAFKYNEKDIPDELMYLRKTVIECPVNVELVSSDGTRIVVLNDKEETSVSNDYGKFVSFFRATTGDYVKIAYFNQADSFTVNAIGTENGKVSYTYVATEDHETYDVSGFHNVLVNTGSSIQIKTDQKTYTIDQDADGVIDIEGEQADKKRIFVQFDYQDGRTIEIAYANQEGHVSFPDIRSLDKKNFAGWYTEPNGAGEEFTYGTIVKASKTVYAKWENAPKLEVPIADIDSGSTVEKGTNIVLSCEDSEAQIFYTIDETEPTRNSLVYSQPITIEEPTIIKAIAVKEGYQDSDVAIFSYTISVEDNPDKVSQGDVLDEDLPQGGIDSIPSGLWIAGVNETGYIYTGKAIKPTVRVYDHKKLLVEKKDFTIAYKNNTKANNAQTAKTAPTITVTGKGNYSGKETQTFQILPKDITDDDIIADDIGLKANRKMQKPVPTVSWNGKKLVNKRDFSVSYTDTTAGAYKNCGTYEIMLSGIGNYSGSRRIALTITESKPVTKLSVSKIADPIYTGNEIEPVLIVKDGKTLLTKNIHYTVSYQNNVNVGTATVLLSGIGDYVGTKRITFKIKSLASLKNAKILLTDAYGQKYNGDTYSGEEIKPSGYTLTITVRGTDGKNTILTLKEGIDYQVSYGNHVQAGNASILFSGINGYTGSIKKTYKIKPYPFENDQTQSGQVKVVLDQSYSYVKGGCKPKPVITFAGRELQENTDYTLSYKNNTRLNNGESSSKQPTVIINGKGNFRGTVSKTFVIVRKSLDDAEFPVTLRVADKGFSDKAGNYISRPVLIDTNGKKLVSGKDYDNNVIYMRENGSLLSKTSRLSVGDKVKVKVTGKGAYSGQLEALYEIKIADFSKAKVTIVSKPYTGSEIVLDQNDITVKLNGTKLKYGTDYEILPESYRNNLKKGTAEVTIIGKGKYGGMKTVKFRIISKKLEWFWRMLE